MSENNIKKMLEENSSSRLQNACNALLQMNFTENEVLSILSSLYKEAEKESSYKENILPAFNRRLKNITSGKLKEKDLRQKLPQNQDTSNQKTTAFQKILDNYSMDDETYLMMPSEEILKAYITVRSYFFETVFPRLIKNGQKEVNRIKINNVYLPDIITGLMTDLEIAAPQYAVELGQYIDTNFTFSTGNDDARTTYYIFLLSYAQALNDLKRYEACDDLIPRMKQTAVHKAKFYQDAASLYMDRPDGLNKAAAIAKKAMEDPSFLADPDRYESLNYFSDIFVDINDTKSQRKAVDLMEEAFDEFNEMDDGNAPVIEKSQRTIVSLMAALEPLQGNTLTPEIQKSFDWLKKIDSFMDNDRRIILAYELSKEILNFAYDSNPRNLKALNEKAESVRKRPLEEFIDILDLFDLSIYKTMTILLEQNYLDLFIKCEAEFYSWIEEIQDDLESDDYTEFSQDEETEDIDFYDFLKNAIDLMQDRFKYEECISFSRHILSLFDFDETEIDTYNLLKEAVAVSMNKLHKYEECDAYLKRWQDINEDAAKPFEVHLKALLDRKKPEEAEELADQIMLMDFSKGKDTNQLYKAVANVYKIVKQPNKRKAALQKMR